jgi:hypothetical protein
MPITFEVDPSKRPQQDLSSLLESRVKSSVEDYIRSACSEQTEICQEVLQASFGDAVRGKETEKDLEKMLKIKNGGLVDVSVEAYNQHYHLVLRCVFVFLWSLSTINLISCSMQA